MSKGSGYIYIIKSLDLYKIGKTINYKSRFGSYSTYNPHGIEIIICQKVKNHDALERFLHRDFKQLRVKGEWFRLSDDDLKFALNKICENMRYGVEKINFRQKYGI